MKPRTSFGAHRLRESSLAAAGGASSLSGRLFVVGSARSGTTILQNALNHSGDVFIMGEPDLHRENEEQGFRARYNARHRSWSNQETKSTFLPPVTEIDGSWRDHVAWLGRHYRWVGAKIVANAIRSPDEMEQIFTFHAREFYDARYIFTFRNPVSVIASTLGLQILSGTPGDDARMIAASYAAVIALYTRMARNFPFVQCVFHEEAGPGTFHQLGDWLGTSLAGSSRYYDIKRVRRRSIEDFEAGDREHLRLLTDLYQDLRVTAHRGLTHPQLEQNDANPDPAHYTPLGSIDRRARVIAQALSQHRDGVP